MEGIVKFFSNERGFGFITAQNKDYFVHYSHIIGEGYKTLVDGERVEFKPAEGKKGPEAQDVRTF